MVPDVADRMVASLARVTDFEACARERMDAVTFDYCAGAAGDERSLRENARAFERVTFRPRVLVDTSQVELSVHVVDERLATPVLLAPIAFNRLVHPDGELAAARAAEAEGTLMVVSAMASATIEEVAAVTRGPLWLQLYVFRDRGLTRGLVERAEAAGYRGIVITVDAPRIGSRPRDARNRFVLPAGISARNLERGGHRSRWGADSTFVDYNAALLESSLSWATIEWVRSVSRRPIILKGVMAPDDAAHAVSSGVSGIVVSNHGGRQLDGAMATLDALPAISDRVGGECSILLDGGVRRGTDVLAALALGANAVLIGRPYLWGLSVAGTTGVRRVLRLLRDELELAMALAGCTRAAAVERALVSHRPS